MTCCFGGNHSKDADVQEVRNKKKKSTHSRLKITTWNPKAWRAKRSRPLSALTGHGRKLSCYSGWPETQSPQWLAVAQRLVQNGYLYPTSNLREHLERESKDWPVIRQLLPNWNHPMRKGEGSWGKQGSHVWVHWNLQDYPSPPLRHSSIEITNNCWGEELWAASHRDFHGQFLKEVKGYSILESSPVLQWAFSNTPALGSC